MSVFAFVVVAAITAQSPLADSVGAATIDKEAGRAYHEINNDIREAMRQEATAETAAAQTVAVEKLCELHWELISDPRIIASPTLRTYRGKIYSRLLRVKKKLEQQIAREARRRSPEENAILEEVAATNQSLMESLSTAAATAGGPAVMLAGSESGNRGELGGGAVNAQRDHGQLLVDLIIKTISPDHWEDNGGPGAIVYYANLHALVITATDEVHEKIGGVVGGLRRAGN